MTMRRRRTIPVQYPGRTIELVYEEQDDGQWKQVTQVILLHPVDTPEADRRTSDDRLIHQPPPQELPVEPVHSDVLDDFILRQAEIDKAKREAHKT